MPTFRITACHAEAKSGFVDFMVQQICGELQVGDRFFCFDTHHPFEYLVSEIHTFDQHTRLVCNGSLGFDDQFTGATVDTSDKSRRDAFRYERPDHEV